MNEKFILELNKKRMIYAYMFITIIIYFIMFLFYRRAVYEDITSNCFLDINELNYVSMLAYIFFPVYSAVSGLIQWKTLKEFISLVIYNLILNVILIYLVSGEYRSYEIIAIYVFGYSIITIITQFITRKICLFIKKKNVVKGK
jgi:hypothetical protein